MKRLVPFVLALSLLSPAPSAFAFYDDVHYYLNYYLARLVGFTPEQAYRMAKAAVSVDYAPSTEPTQLELGKKTLVNSPVEAAKETPLFGLIVEMFASRGIMDVDGINSRIDALSESVANLSEEDVFDSVFAPQWKYHAFRDVHRFPLAKVDGPPYPTPEEQNQSLAADAAVLEQRKLLFQEALHEKNPGIFLHFFQDEIPHHGYSTGGGHWVLTPEQWAQNALWRSAVHDGKRFPAWTDFWEKSFLYDKKGAMPSGSTTDWLTWRSHESNLDLLTKTAQFMIDFMNESSQGKQHARMSAAEAARIANQGFLLALRYANVAPPSLTDMHEVIATKSLQATHGEKKKGTAEEEEKFGQQADGPNLAAAEKVVNEALAALGVENVPAFPHEHNEKIKWSYPLVNRSDTSGATFVDMEGRQLLYVDVHVKVKDASVVDRSTPAPRQIEVVLNSVPTHKNETAYVIDRKSTNAFGPLDGSQVLLDFSRIPAGEVLIEVRYLDSNNATVLAFDKKVKLETRSTDVTVEAPDAKSIRSAVADAFHSLGLAISFATSPNPDYTKPPLDEVTGKLGASKNLASEGIVTVVATIEDDEETAKRFARDIQAGGDFDAGTEELALVRSNRLLLYPSDGTRWPKGQGTGHFRCGVVLLSVQTFAESDRGFAQGESPANFDKEEERLKPEAIRLNQEWVLKISKALGNHRVCEVRGVNTSTTSPDTGETGINGASGPSDTGANSSPAPGNQPGISGTPTPTNANPRAVGPVTNAGTADPAVTATGATLSTPVTSGGLQKPFEEGAAKVATVPAVQSSPDVPAVAGIYRWDWANGGEPVDQGATATFNVDGTSSSSYGHQGRWRIENGTVVIEWSNGDRNDLHATADPNVWEGASSSGARIRAFKQVAYNFGKDPIQVSSVPGVWKWDWNKAGEPVDQGASATFYPDGTMTSSYSGYFGTWTVEGGTVKLVWTNVNQTNTLYSTADPNVFEGWGQFGERIRATKQQSITAQNPSYEYGIDRPGWDYSHFPLEAPNPDLCASHCQRDSQCRAWTYVKPGYQGSEPMCWLKNSVPPQVMGADFAVSGVTRP